MNLARPITHLAFALTSFTATFAYAATPVAPTSFEFMAGGKKVQSETFTNLRAGHLIAAKDIELVEPQAKEKRRFKALPINELLEHVYGKNWTEAKMLIVTCLDGYRPAIPVKHFLAHPAFLAFAYADGSPFVTTKTGKKLDVGPTYIVWPDPQTDAELAKSLEAGDWPYQVKAFDLIR